MKKRMIRAFMNKLAKESGMTIVFALTAFLISCLISVVIVSNAMQNVQRIKRQKNAQQMNLAISSAASYVEKLFDGCRAVRYVSADGSTLQWWEYANNQELDKLFSAADTDFRMQYKALIENGQALSWQIRPTSENQSVKDALSVVLKVKRDGDDIVATLSNAEKNEDGTIRTGRYSMSFLFTANKYAESDRTQRVDEDGKKTGKKIDCLCTVYEWKYASLVR